MARGGTSVHFFLDIDGRKFLSFHSILIQLNVTTIEIKTYKMNSFTWRIFLNAQFALTLILTQFCLFLIRIIDSNVQYIVKLPYDMILL